MSPRRNTLPDSPLAELFRATEESAASSAGRRPRVDSLPSLGPVPIAITLVGAVALAALALSLWQLSTEPRGIRSDGPQQATAPISNAAAALAPAPTAMATGQETATLTARPKAEPVTVEENAGGVAGVSEAEGGRGGGGTAAASEATSSGINEQVVVRSGDEGDDVRALQVALASLGYEVGEPDGVFGAETHDVVVHFQGDAGLNPDGVVGAETAHAINDALNELP